MCVYQIQVIPRELHFKQPAGTSRGVYTTRKVWYVEIIDIQSGKKGVGECAPLPDLSCDALPEYETILRDACRELSETGVLHREKLLPYPSILFGLETALQHLEAGSFRLWDTAFSRGEQGIPINGLVWMGTFEEMYQRMQEKLDAGFRCIKLKIGAINFEKELELLAYIRKFFSPEQVILRVDANGAFSPEEAEEKIRQLSAFSLHSIEQPIRAGQWKEMARLCKSSALPIALDEELIGVNRREDKIALLDSIAPDYLILKPSLHGGISGSEEWIELAEERGIGYWVTSALESNIGLNAIAQWCATLQPAIPQGLGTGLLFTDNVDMPLCIRKDELWYDAFLHDLKSFQEEWNDAGDTVWVHTSGSTGTPKPMRVEKHRMRASAQLTCAFLGLKQGDSALLCMPLKYIAGKMVAVRAWVAGMRLIPVTPCGHPLKDLNEVPVFAAMIPMQVYNSLQVPEEKERLMSIRHLIIGGGAIDAALGAALKDFPHAVYSTYGMTETLSHIALRRLNGPLASDWYTPLEGVKVRLSTEGTLCIQAPRVCEGELVTNDVAELNEQGQFRIWGRKDNIINSGGVKIQIEQVEDLLRSHLSQAFFITSAPDEKFGEIVVLLLDENSDGVSDEIVRNICQRVLPSYWCPKQVVRVKQLPLTGTGKPDRAAAKRLAAL